MICVTFLTKEKEMEKQKLLYQQARLHDRGAAEMVLQTISASKGKSCLSPPTVYCNSAVANILRPLW